MAANPEIPDEIRQYYDNKPEEMSWDDHMVVVTRMCQQAMYARAQMAPAASSQLREVKDAATVGEASDHSDPDEEMEQEGYTTHGSGRTDDKREMVIQFSDGTRKRTTVTQHEDMMSMPMLRTERPQQAFHQQQKQETNGMLRIEEWNNLEQITDETQAKRELERVNRDTQWEEQEVKLAITGAGKQGTYQIPMIKATLAESTKVRLKVWDRELKDKGVSDEGILKYTGAIRDKMEKKGTYVPPVDEIPYATQIIMMKEAPAVSMLSTKEMRPSEYMEEGTRDETEKAVEKELDALINTTKSIEIITEEEATSEWKDRGKKILSCRFSMTRKRPTGKEKRGKMKARLVAQDLKRVHAMEEYETYAGVPEISALRLVVATNEREKHRWASTDFDTAFLQAKRYTEEEVTIIKFFHPITREWVYARLYTPLYGKQDSAKRWQDTLQKMLLEEMEMKEIRNCPSAYIHRTKDIIMLVHVDDPIVRTSSEEEESWFFETLEKHFRTKGMSRLKPGNDLDYLSMIIRTNTRGDVWLGNDVKIQEVLLKYEMDKAKGDWGGVTTQDIDEVRIKMEHEGGTTMRSHSGTASWLANTTCPYASTTASVMGGVNLAPDEDSLKLMKKVCKMYSAGKEYGLMRLNSEGLKCQFDAGWAGERSHGNGPRQSRSGVLITMNGMPVNWSSKRQQIIALASAESEMYAGSEATKWVKHMAYILDELRVGVEKPLQLFTDSSALKQLIDSGARKTLMKHVDLRAGWLEEMTDTQEIRVSFVRGVMNGSDILTKLVNGARKKEWCEKYMMEKSMLME